MTLGDENWTKPAAKKVRRRVEVTLDTQSLAVALGYPEGAKVHLDTDQIRITWEDGPEPERPYKGQIDVGTEFILHPDVPLDRKRVIVTNYQPENHYEAAYVWTSEVGRTVTKEVGYTESQFREIAVPAHNWG